MTQQFYVVAAKSEIPEGGQMFIQLDEEEILLCHHNSHYYAIAYHCSHAEFTLEGGTMHNDCITCPYHGAEFSLTDGSVQTPPAWEGIRTYPVKVEDETILVCPSPIEPKAD
ncbi:MAG: nitrite reductase/ring-hydroxylating ferredoxin subunit [Candidatus Azotimanducaceae bacterium]|jgi:nitrite reductase/ring-hydroxylating ferredoxin subunit